MKNAKKALKETGKNYILQYFAPTVHKNCFRAIFQSANMISWSNPTVYIICNVQRNQNEISLLFSLCQNSKQTETEWISSCILCMHNTRTNIFCRRLNIDILLCPRSVCSLRILYAIRCDMCLCMNSNTKWVRTIIMSNQI